MTARVGVQIKVDVAKLRQRVADRLAKAQQEYAEAAICYKTECEKYRDEVSNSLLVAYGNSLNGKFPENEWGKRDKVVVNLSVSKPNEPDDREVRRIKADLSLLDMATDETISIGSSSDRFAEYL